MKNIAKLLVFFLCISASSQTSEKSDFWKNVRFGGGFGLSFGNTTTINIAPTAVYDFKSGFSLGAGLGYTRSEQGATVNTNMYSGSILALYRIPVINIRLSSEFEQSFGNQTNLTNKVNFTNTSLLLGLAWGSGRFAYGFRYDVLHDDTRSIYSSPISPIVRFFF